MYIIELNAGFQIRLFNLRCTLGADYGMEEVECAGSAVQVPSKQNRVDKSCGFLSMREFIYIAVEAFESRPGRPKPVLSILNNIKYIQSYYIVLWLLYTYTQDISVSYTLDKTNQTKSKPYQANEMQSALASRMTLMIKLISFHFYCLNIFIYILLLIYSKY